MSRPSTTFFCKKGHLLEECGEGEYSKKYDLDYGIIPRCPICNEVVGSIFNWEEFSELSVSMTPKYNDYVERKDDFGNIYFERVPVYDVSSINFPEEDNN